MDFPLARGFQSLFRRSSEILISTAGRYSQKTKAALRAMKQEKSLKFEVIFSPIKRGK